MKEEFVLGKLIESLKSLHPDFHHGTCKFVAGSDTSGSLSFHQNLYNEKDVLLEYSLFDLRDFNPLLRQLFVNINDEKKVNVFECSIISPNEYTHKLYWDQSVQDEFEDHLPINERGKFIPWYVPGSDYRKKTLAQEHVEKDKTFPWQLIGKLIEEFEIQYLSPIHYDYPQWAGDRYLQLWHTHWNTYMVCTQGLYEEGDETSLDLELYLETVEKPDNFGNSWQANIVYELGKLLPKVSDLKQRFETYKYISVQIAMDGAPEEWSLPEHDNIGVLLGIEHEEFQKRNIKFPFRPLNCKLLRPAETKMIKKLNVQGREKLVNFFRQKGNATISSLSRPSVVKDE